LLLALLTSSVELPHAIAKSGPTADMRVVPTIAKKRMVISPAEAYFVESSHHPTYFLSSFFSNSDLRGFSSGLK